ncbi:MAG: type II/IV secretion system protein [Planctomycetes bacterium]|nr:type II/IV secretion system protein [Planctomycetota bacterium]
MDDFKTFLVSRKIIQKDQLDDLSVDDSFTLEPVYYQILRKFPELEYPIWRALADFLQLDLVDPHQIAIKPDLAQLVPARLAYQYSLVPIEKIGHRLEIALADPRQFEKCDEFALLLSQQSQSQDKNKELLTVIPRLTTPSAVSQMITACYGIGADKVQEVIEGRSGDDESEPAIAILGSEVVDITAVEGASEEAAIVRFVNQVLLEAVKISASDIHLEPFEKELRVRYRIDGMLQSEPLPDRLKNLEAAIISRIKIMAGMDIAEKRLPQDGQIRLIVMGRPIDVRVSVLPTLFGQGLALRLLDSQITFRQLDNLEMPEDYLRLYSKVLKLSHGVILVTGPTGSGKTTTLYASLNELNRPDRKIITVEDPIEYQMDGISQIQIKPVIGLTFANVLRNILRHDPDIIMIGEIRDAETAEIAISAAMTGHLVFSTLHTNDAPSALVRLLDMDLEPYLVSSALEAVIAQRLIRRLCPDCRIPIDASEGLDDETRVFLEDAVVYQAKGCPECRQTGYRGRQAIYEMFSLSNKVRQMVLHRTDAGQIRQEVLSLGMRTLRQAGLEKVRQGITSLVEVYRVARDETIDMQSLMKGA